MQKRGIYRNKSIRSGGLCGCMTYCHWFRCSSSLKRRGWTPRVSLVDRWFGWEGYEPPRSTNVLAMSARYRTTNHRENVLGHWLSQIHGGVSNCWLSILCNKYWSVCSIVQECIALNWRIVWKAVSRSSSNNKATDLHYLQDSTSTSFLYSWSE